MLVGEREAEDVQAVGRVTVLAEASKLTDSAAIEAAALRYYRFFPESESYHSAHDFDFWVLTPVRYRFIGGFGAIHWLEGVALTNPFAGAGETSMIEHMNDDHTKAIAHYVELSGLPHTELAKLVGIDSEGMHLRIGAGIYWLPFAHPCNTPIQVREALVQLAHAEKWPVAEAEEA
jgi:putative heme iron utilization protein